MPREEVCVNFSRVNLELDVSDSKSGSAISKLYASVSLDASVSSPLKQ